MMFLSVLTVDTAAAKEPYRSAFDGSDQLPSLATGLNLMLSVPVRLVRLALGAWVVIPSLN